MFGTSAKRISLEPGMVAHACNLSIGEAGAGGRSSRPARLHGEMLFKKNPEGIEECISGALSTRGGGRYPVSLAC